MPEHILHLLQRPVALHEPRGDVCRKSWKRKFSIFARRSAPSHAVWKAYQFFVPKT